MHMGQNHVLLVRNAQFIMAEIARDVRQSAHLRRAGVPRRRTGFFQTDRDNSIAGLLVRGDVRVQPSAKRGVV